MEEDELAIRDVVVNKTRFYSDLWIEAGVTIRSFLEGKFVEERSLRIT